MTHATYTLSGRQVKDAQLGVIRVALPIPRDWPDELWDSPDGSPEVVQWICDVLGVVPQQVGGVEARDVATAPGLKAPGLTGLLGRIVQDGEQVDVWSVWVWCVVAEIRGARTIRAKPGPIQWPGSVRFGEWRYPPAAE